jgi:hypothetical protein
MSNHEYRAYLRSNHWRQFRKSVLAVRSECETCGCKSLLNVHHLTYANIGYEDELDVMVLCDACHSRVHGKTINTFQFLRGKKPKANTPPKKKKPAPVKQPRVNVKNPYEVSRFIANHLDKRMTDDQWLIARMVRAKGLDTAEIAATVGVDPRKFIGFIRGSCQIKKEQVAAAVEYVKSKPFPGNAV